MTADELVLGVDLGTSGARAVAFDPELRAVAQVARAYPVQWGANGAAEQRVEDVVDAAETCIRAAGAQVADRIVAVAFCSTASSLAVFAPDDGDTFTPQGPAWIWADNRAAADARELAAAGGMDTYARTGCPSHASYWPAKLGYRRRTGLPPYTGADASAAPMLAGIKDFVLYQLTGVWATDVATAAATGLYDSAAGRWDDALTRGLAVDPAWLPAVVPMDTAFDLLPAAAQRLGLDPAVKIVAGGLDGVLVHLGMGCAQAGLASCTIGTSCAARMSADHRVTDRAARTWCYPVADGLWLAGGAGNNGGNVLTWFGGLLGEMARFAVDSDAPLETGTDRIIELAMTVDPGADGLLLAPYLFGERSPLWREDLTGAFVGLKPTHRLPHLARAVLEGVSLGVDGIFRALVEQIERPRAVRAGGGFVASPAWVQVQADVLGVPVEVTAGGLETATGAAMVAWRAQRGTPLAAHQAAVPVTRTFTPDPDRHARYRELYARLQEVSACLTPSSP